MKNSNIIKKKQIKRKKKYSLKFWFQQNQTTNKQTTKSTKKFIINFIKNENKNNRNYLYVKINTN